MESYWSCRYTSEGMIWGGVPSPSATLAKEWFHHYEVETVFVPGAGYGRNTKALSEHFKVDGLELSAEAVELGKSWDPRTSFYVGSALDFPSAIRSKTYDAVYCYDLLHLFLERDRKRLLDQCSRVLKKHGLMFFTFFSDEDADYGKGREVESHTFEVKPGKIAHFYSEQEMRKQFAGWRVLETGHSQEELQYQDGSCRTYRIRTIIVQRSI